MFRKCPNCSQRVVKGSQYCIHCGEKLPPIQKNKRRTVNKKFGDVNFADGKQVFNRYQRYFLERLKEPTVSMRRGRGKQSFQFGLIQLLVILLVNSLTVLTFYGKLTARSLENVGLPFISLFIGALVLQGLFLFSMIVSLYISTNYLKKVPTTVQTVISRIGGLASSQLILSFFLFLAVLLELNLLVILSIYLLGLISIASMNFYLMTTKNNSTISNFYILLLAMGLFLVIQISTYNFVLRFSTNPQIYPEIIRMFIG